MNQGEQEDIEDFESFVDTLWVAVGAVALIVVIIFLLSEGAN